MASFLLDFKCVKLMDVKVSRKRLMQHMIEYKYVPVKQTTLYKICKKLKLKDLPQDATWNKLQKHGCKPFISRRGLQQLIDNIKMSTVGNVAMSTSDIRDLVSKRIKEEWFAKGHVNFLPDIHINTLNVYTNIIKSQSVFNIHSSVSNKTQARAAAEWSICSTILYALTVACTHFIRDVTVTDFHPKRKDLSEESLEMWNKVEMEYNKMIGNEQNDVKLQPILPNLITSTDEVTVFVTASVLHGKESFYLVSRPTYVKNEAVNSSARNDYKKRPTAHCCGLRIVINCTFTASGLSLPLFVVVYEVTKEEMPLEDEMVTIKIPGLTTGSDQDIYSNGYGYLTFVKGKHEEDEVDSHEPNDDDHQQVPNPSHNPSKESKIAAKYRHLIYHPFIDHIRVTHYNWNSIVEPEVPSHLTAVSWMDGANGQLKKITSERSIEFEGKRKVICCKHSASHTAVEHTANTGLMFKAMKILLKEMETPNATINCMYHYLDQQLKDLQEKGTLILATHKKKAVMATIPKLPSVTGRSHLMSNVHKGFVLNGQLDVDNKMVPSFNNILHTYRGDNRKTCLENKDWILSKFYKEI